MFFVHIPVINRVSQLPENHLVMQNDIDRTRSAFTPGWDLLNGVESLPIKKTDGRVIRQFRHDVVNQEVGT